MNYLKLACLGILASLLLSGCKGTGVLIVPSKDDAVNEKLKVSPAFLDGFWQGMYDKSKIEVEAKADKGEGKSSTVTVWVYEKDKKQPMIPMKVFVLAVKKNEYLIAVADTNQLLTDNNYSPISGNLLYPVLKIFKLTRLGSDKISFQEVIFIKKLDKGKVASLSPDMKMWGENSNMIYGTASEVISYLEAGKYELSEENVLTKTAEKK